MDQKSVAIRCSDTSYSIIPPYNPNRSFPEFGDRYELDPSNQVFEEVRELFHLLRYDSARFDSSEWNPLGWLVSPGQTVFIKPNMISHKHALNNDWDYVITHGSIIRVVIDYVVIALKGKGRIIVGDAPQTDSKITEIMDHMGLRAIQGCFRLLKDIKIELVDLRDEYWVEKDGIYVDTVRLIGDPLSSIEVDLSENSLLSELDGKGNRYYGAYYNVDETNKHHRDGKHEYAISKTPIIADVFINIPKLKSHKKCGITVNLKSLVGINANKNWLPHYIIGSPDEGGDQFDKGGVKSKMENAIVLKAKQILLKDGPIFQVIARKTKRLGYKIFGGTEKVVRSGNWHGNDTVWRMSLDLNRILTYANPDGSMRDSSQPKKFLSLVDGIESMEGNGPVAGTRLSTGIIVAGANPVTVDTACTRIMGFDYRKLPLVLRAFDTHKYPLTTTKYESIQILSNKNQWNKPLCEIKFQDTFHFKPHFGWVGAIEARD